MQSTSWAVEPVAGHCGAPTGLNCQQQACQVACHGRLLLLLLLLLALVKCLGLL
jgi:hypothetical protein